MVWPLKKPGRKTSLSSVDSQRRRPRSFFFWSMKKRRNSQRDDMVTENTADCSFTSDMSTIAPWRVENIRLAPPKSEDWWIEDSRGDGEEMNSGDGVEGLVMSAYLGSSSSSSSTHPRRFHNCGLETWLKAREEWTRRTVETPPSKPSPVEYNRLARGLVKHIGQRTYELPQRMALSDLVDVYNDIWDGQCL